MKAKKGQDEAINQAETINEEEVYDFKPDVQVETNNAEDAKYDELHAKYIRLQADFENFKRRNSSTASVMYSNGINDMLADILPVLDYLDMAIEAQKDEEQRKGIELVKNAFMDVITKRGVKEMGAVGDKFDPNIHEAVMSASAQKPEDVGIIVEVFKKGYARDDKILRHAKVIVAQ